jgi:putative endonuclease
MHYVYIIKSKKFPNKKYIGCTSDPKKRLYNHNSGTTPHTKKYVPWEIINLIGFKDKEKAIAFENYLKSGSGRAFALKRFL